MYGFAHRVLVFFLFGVSSSLYAQQRFQVGVFLDYLNLSHTNTNNVGLGGRFGYRTSHHMTLEGEVTYDYGVNFEEAYRNVVNGNIVAIERTSIGFTQGLFGPKLQGQGHGFRPFVTLKGGFVDFRLSPSLLPYSSFLSTLTGIRTSSLNAALYPAAGIEGILGPVGLRFEMGDEVYFNHGAQNNLRITFGPTIRF